MGRTVIVAVAIAMALAAPGPALAENVGAMQRVYRTVYGTAPNSQALAKHQGDGVVFQENVETWEDSGALLHFIDGSHLTMGAKSKVLIDEFVFDPKTASGNALIRITGGTLRWVTGSMPKGQTVIKTPTSTLTLRGTDVAVHVHPDGTTDTTVYEGTVYNHNDITDTNTVMGPGDQQVADQNGNHADTDDPVDPGDFTGGRTASNETTTGDPSEHLAARPEEPAEADRSQTPDRPQTDRPQTAD